MNGDDVRKNFSISAMNSERYVIEKKLEKSQRIAWIVCAVSFLLFWVFGFMMSANWYPDSVLQGWPMVISILFCLCSLIVAINQSIKLAKFKRTALMYAEGGSIVSGSKLVKNSSVNSVVSLVCALIPIALYLWYSVFIFSKVPLDTHQYGLIIVVYYWTIGFWLVPVWLICGILGLKSEKRTMAIVSLVIKPIGLILFAILMPIAYSL